MKPTETPSKPLQSPYRFKRVRDRRKHRVRGLWERNGRFYARLTAEDTESRKRARWAALEAQTATEAAEELKTLHVEGKENRLSHIGKVPKVADFAATYL